MKTVTHNTLFLTGASIIQKALSFIYFTLLARTFTADQIGAYSYSLAFTTIFSIIVDGGLTPVLIRYTAKNPERARSLLVQVLKIKVVLLFVSAIAMLGAVYAIDAAFSTRHLIMAAAVVMIVDAFNLSAYGSLRGNQNLAYESVGMIAAQFTSLCVVIGVVTQGAPIYWAIIGLGIGSLVNSLVALYGLSKIHDAAGATPHEISGRTFVREATPFALAGVFARGYSFLDLLLLGSLTNFATAGTYSIANKMTFVFQFIPLALSASLYPAFSKMLAAGEREAVTKLWYASERYLLLSAGVIMVVLISLRAEILGFFGKAHVDATLTLVLLALALVFAFMSYPVGAALNAAGLQKFQTIAMAATLLVNIVMNIVLIRAFGSEGAALSALVGNMVLFGVGAWFAHRKITSLPWARIVSSAGRIFVASVGAIIAVTVIGSSFKLGENETVFKQLAIIGALSAVGGIIYILIALAARAITKDEIQELMGRLKNRL